MWIIDQWSFYMSRSVWHKEYLDKWSLGTKKGKELMITWVKWGVGGGWTMSIWCFGIPTSVCTYSILHSINTLTCMKDLSIMSIFSLRFNLVLHNAQERNIRAIWTISISWTIWMVWTIWIIWTICISWSVWTLFELDLNHFQGNRDAGLQCGQPARAVSSLKCWNHYTSL